MRHLTTVLGGLLVAGVAYAGGHGMLNSGDRFPEWLLVDATGAHVGSRDLAGRLYLLWYYPKAMTSGCTAEGCALRDNFDEFKKAGVEVLGVSFDRPEANAEFIAKNNFPFRLLSDQNKILAIQVGAAESDKALFARRISYLIGPNGNVLKAYDNVNPRTHAGQVLADLAELTKAK